MTVQTTLQKYLADSGESMRALSLRANLNPKAVSDMLRIPGLRPSRKSLVALSEASGMDFLACANFEDMTYAELLRRLEAQGHAILCSRVRILLRHANWIPEIRRVCRREVIAYFEAHNAAGFGVAPGTYGTYKSDVLKAIRIGTGRQRGRTVKDIAGEHGALHDAISQSAIAQSYKAIAGSFLVYLHDRNIALSDMTTDVLAGYYSHRLEISSKTESKCRQHVTEIACMLTRLSRDRNFRRFSIPEVSHPFADGRDKYKVDDAMVAPLLEDFDQGIAPWARGEVSRTGETREAFIARLDAEEAPISDERARLRAARTAKRQRSGESSRPIQKSDEDKLAINGFLTPKGQWKGRTLKTRRGYIVSLAKAFVAATDVLPDTLEELCDPEFLESAAEALDEANKGEHTSGYVASVLKTVKKIARDYYEFQPRDMERINDLISRHDVRTRGIAPRNKAKLQKFTQDRIRTTLNLADGIVTRVNAEIGRKRKAWRREHGVAPEAADIITPALAQDVMAALAHDILIARAPRTENVVNCRLDWIAWQDGRARIVVPSVAVKMRGKNDPDLVIPLLDSTSRILRRYLDTIRPAVLRPEDAGNPYLFPGQAAEHQFEPGRPYASLLGRVTRLVKRDVGVDINPHLYRHLLGWIWLKDSIDNLPAVQRLLGHKSLQTTLDHYAELDDRLVFDAWQDRINREKARA